MCLSCGCERPNDSHGDARHITLGDLKEAAQAAKISVDDAADNIAHTVHSDVHKGHQYADPAAQMLAEYL
jgi:hypothetical protein